MTEVMIRVDGITEWISLEDFKQLLARQMLSPAELSMAAQQQAGEGRESD